jgi:cytosine/creatinine deaminase
MPIPFADIAWPDPGPGGGSYRLANARVPACFLADAPALAADAEGVVRVDLLIADDRIARVEPAVEPTGAPATATEHRIDLGGRQVWPTLVDVHTHLDKGHTVGRAPNLDGTFHNARLAAVADRPARTREDLVRRMGFGLRCAHGHGVSAIRTHLDTYPDSAEHTWEALAEVRAAWAGRVELQAVALCPIDLIQDAYGDRIAALVAQTGGVLGGVTRASVGDHGPPSADIDAMLDRLFQLAARHDLDIDLHVDESGDPAVATLPHVARAAIRHGYRGRVTCGHCCSLAVQPDDEALRTLDLVAEAEIAVVSLPTVNMYLQDRIGGRTPRWRGVTLIHEMRRRGITVAVAGDNCRDSFYAYGDHDMVDTFRQAVRILHLDHPVSGAATLVGPAPATMAGLSGHGRIAVGGAASVIVFNARTLNELISRPQSDRVVIRGGHRLTADVPDYSELWAED